MIRDELLRLRASAELETEALFSASRDSNADDEHDPEGATIGFDRAQLIALLDAARERIGEVDDALGRVHAVTYAVCERCGQPIAGDGSPRGRSPVAA